MRRRGGPQPYLLLCGVLFLLLSTSPEMAEKLRGRAVALLAPLWGSATALSAEEEFQQLQLENHLLRTEVAQLQERHHRQEGGESQLCLPARVIYRSPNSWNSSLWLNVGAADHPLVVKNSPVVVGTAVVGVIDYVGSHQSRVRLITDSGLTPSVRAVRGEAQVDRLIGEIDTLRRDIFLHSDLFADVEDAQKLILQLEDAVDKLAQGEPTAHLAKGEIHGTSQPLWRSRSHLLEGVGFNYDFADEKGPARDLRTGRPIGAEGAPIPILKVHDLLVTTGMDGVFPEGLHVGIVTDIRTLKEGDYTYHLEAKPAAGNLDELSLVFIIPPIGYDPTDQPPLNRW